MGVVFFLRSLPTKNQKHDDLFSIKKKMLLKQKAPSFSMLCSLFILCFSNWLYFEIHLHAKNKINKY